MPKYGLLTCKIVDIKVQDWIAL